MSQHIYAVTESGSIYLFCGHTNIWKRTFCLPDSPLSDVECHGNFEPEFEPILGQSMRLIREGVINPDYKYNPIVIYTTKVIDIIPA